MMFLVGFLIGSIITAIVILYFTNRQKINNKKIHVINSTKHNDDFGIGL